MLELDTGVELGLSRGFVVEVIEDAVDVLKLIDNEEMAETLLEPEGKTLAAPEELLRLEEGMERVL